MRGDGEREFVAGKQNAATFFLAKIDMLLELGERDDPVFELPFPIVPRLGRDPAAAGPITGRVRDELFPVPFSIGKRDHLSWEQKR